MVHPFDQSTTPKFVNTINDRSNLTKNIKAFVLIDSDLKRDVGFDSGIQDITYVTRVDKVNGRMLEEEINRKVPNFLGGHYS